MGRKGNTIGVVDFGSRRIRVLIARQDDGGSVTILGHGTAPGNGCISQGVIQDRVAAQQALKTALAHAEKEARAKVETLFCGINGRNIETFMREGVVDIPRSVVEQEHVVQARELATADILAPDVSLATATTAEEWYVDNLRVLNPIGIRGSKLKTRIHVARVPRVIEENLVLCVESQKRRLEDVLFLPIAASLGSLTLEDIELGVVVIDIGHSTTGLAVYRNHRLLGTHVFEWGGFNITRDVAAGLHISFQEAEELAMQYGISEKLITALADNVAGSNSKSAKPIPDRPQIMLKSTVPGVPAIVDRDLFDQIVFERAKEMLARIHTHLKNDHLARNMVRGVVLTGGGGILKHMNRLAEAVMRVPCRVGTPHLVEVIPHAVESCEYAGAVGMARYAFQCRSAVRSGRVPVMRQLGLARGIARFFREYFL